MSPDAGSTMGAEASGTEPGGIEPWSMPGMVDGMVVATAVVGATMEAVVGSAPFESLPQAVASRVSAVAARSVRAIVRRRLVGAWFTGGAFRSVVSFVDEG